MGGDPRRGDIIGPSKGVHPEVIEIKKEKITVSVSVNSNFLSD